MVWLVVVLMVILAVEAVTEWPGDGCGGRGHDLRKEGRKQPREGRLAFDVVVSLPCSSLRSGATCGKRVCGWLGVSVCMCGCEGIPTTQAKRPAKKERGEGGGRRVS